ncbi:MAG: hypothetical protein KBB01_00235 [Candidatus Omnitrophica bacterium]|nr:hypothetical protein [Candidatus Omnitrophota bacterium]
MKKKKLLLKVILCIGGVIFVGSVLATSFSSPEINKIPASPPVAYEKKEDSTGSLFNKEFSLSGLIPTFGTIEEETNLSD